MAKRHPPTPATPRPPRGIVARQAARIAELESQLQSEADSKAILHRELRGALDSAEDYKRSLAESQAGNALTRNELAQAKTTIASQARLIGELEQFRFYTRQGELRRSVEQNGASFPIGSANLEEVY